MFRHLAPLRQCQAILLLHALHRNHPLLACQQLLKMAHFPLKESERLADNIPLASIYPINVKESWKSCPGFTRFPLIAGRSSSCKRLINATSFSISMTLVEI